MILPDDIATWSRDRRVQWFANKLWASALEADGIVVGGDDDHKSYSAPREFVAEVAEAIEWVRTHKEAM